MTIYRHFIQNDFKMIGRDPMLTLSLFAPILLTSLVLFGVPVISDWSVSLLNFSFESEIPLIKLFFLPICPMIFGMVYGFILLDERDGGLIGYFSITPFGKSGYLTARMFIPVIYSFIFSLLYLELTGLVHEYTFLQQLCLALIFASEAPMMLLFLGAFAGNKVEGMAITKGFGILLISMIPSHFIQNPWLNLLAISPMWWVERALFVPETTWFFLAGGMLVHLVFNLLLYRKFLTRFG